MNFSIGNLNGTNANISSLISDLIARKSSAMNTLLEQKSSIETSLAALQNSALGTGSINNSYSSQIASLQDTIDTLKEQYTINSNKLSTINSLNNSYKKVVSTLDDYIESLKNPNKNDTTPTWTNSNSNVADVTINSNGASIQRVDLTVTQLATTSIIKSEFLSGGSISLDTKITDLFAGKYDSATNTITSTRTDLNENIKLSELGITNGSFKLGSHTIRVDSSKTLGDLMNEINSLGGYTAKLETTYDANGNAVSSFSITGSNGKSVGITNVANALNIKGNMTSDTKLSQLGIESGVYQVGNQQITVDAKKDTVGSLIEKISSAGYNASIVNDPDNAGSKKLLITDASGDEVVNETASNFASVIGLTVSEGNFTINGESFDINASTTIGSLINDINKATADGVGAKLENNKLVFVASKTGEIDINVGKGTSNFTNAIGFTVGGVMNKDNLVMGSDGSYVTLAGLNQGIKNTDSVKNGKFTTGNFTISYNKIDKNGVALDEMLTTEINITEDDTVESIIQKIKDQTQQTYTDKNGNIVTTSLTAEIVDGKFQIRQTQKGAQYKIAVSAGSSTFTEYVGLTQKVNPGVATSGSATTFTGIKDVTADMTFSEGNFKITASKANDPSQTESVVIDVAQGETLQSVIDKINDSGLAITAQIKDGKLQLMHNNYGADYSISVEAGSSDFTNKVGFTAETSVGVSNNGTNSTLTGLVGGFTLNSASFSEGSFVLQTNALSSDGKTASDDMLSAVIEVKSTDTIQDIINKINSATVNYNGQDVSLGLTASLTADGKIQIQQNNGGEGFDIKVEAGDTNFTQKVGLTTSVSTGVSSSATVSYVIGSSSYDGTFSGGSFKISTNAVDESGKGAAFDMLSVDVNIQEGSKLNDDLINSINSQINSIGLHASITSDGKIKIEQLNAGADFDIKIEAGNTNFTQKTGLTTDVQNIGTLTPGRDVNQFTSLTGVNNVSEDTAVSQGTFKINGVTINFNDGNIASAIEQINALKDQTGVNAYLKDGKVVLQANVTGPDTTIYVENGTSSFGEVAGFISQSSMGGSATIGQVGSKTTLTGAYDVSDDTTVSGGTIKINGYDIVIDSGSLKDAIDKINSASDKTGVTADIVNNRFVLTNTTNSTNSISVEAGSSDIAQKTGIAAYQSKQGTQEIKNATKSALKASKQNLSGAESITNSSITINGQKIDLSGNVNSAINQINNYSSTTGVKAYLDEDGRFTLENIETGKKAISVSFVSGDFGKVIGAVASSGSGSSSGSSNSGNITVTPGGDVIVTPGGNNSNINGGSNSSTGSSSFIQGGNSNLNNNSQIIGGGSLNIGEKDYSASVSRMTEEEALAKGYTVVKTADELYEAMLLDEQNIILMNDIDFSAFSTINSFTGTLDGNGYTLSNISGYLIESAENATIKNLAVNSSGSYNLDSLIYEAANTTLDTVYIVGFDSAIKNAFDEINISDAFIGGQSGGYGFIETVHAADVTIKNSLNFMSANPGGLLIGSNENGNVTIKNAYGAGTGDIIGSNTGTVTIENVYNLDNSQFEDVQVITDGIDGLLGIPGFVKDNNSGLPISEKLANTFTSIFTEGYTKPGVSVDLSDCNTIGDVIDKINATNSGYVASLENGKFTIRKEGSTEEFTVDYSGAGNFGYVTGLEDYTIGKATGTKRLTEAEAIAQGYTIIKTAQDLQNIKNNLGGKYILMGDIDLSSISAWEAIGATESSAFSGTFDGNGYSIKNLTTGFALYNGLFGVVTGTIKNLNLDNVRIDTVTKPDGTSTVSTSAGAVAGWLKGTISNVSVTNSYIYGGLMAGGLVGSSGGNITNSYTENTTVTGNGYLGGLTGSLTGVISHSYSLSQVIAKGGTNLTGAITGGDGDTTKTGSINDVYFDSRISGVTTAVGPSGTLASETLVKDLANLTGSFDSSIWNTSGEHPTLWASSKSLTGATVYGLTENTIFAGLQSGSLSVDVEGTTFNVQLSGTDTLKESLEKIKAEFEKRGFEFNYKIDGGKVIIASDKYFTFDNNNEFIKLSGLSTEGVTYKANFTSGIEYGSNVLTGSVSGLTLDTVLNGLNNGSYTIKQGGQNAFTFTASSTDTIGDIINKINAGGMYIAGLDEEGRFYIESGGSASANSTLNSIAADGTEFVKITEAEAKSQGYTVVKTAQEFLAAIKGHTNVNTQAKIILMNDIDFGGMSIDSISDFYGEINGNGYTLSNLNINGSALFDNTNFALIQNAIISDFHVKTESDYVGPAAVVFGNACHAIFDNVILQNSSVETDGYAGGLIASLVDSCIITNTVVSNTVLNGQMGSGGFVGVCGQSGMTLNISNSGVYNITNTTQNNYSSNGGLVAYVHRSPMINVTNTYVYFDPAFTAASNQNWYAIAGDTEVLGTLFAVSGNFTSNGIVPDNFTPGGTGTIDTNEAYTLEDIKNKNQNIDWQVYSNGGLISSSMAGIFNIKNNDNTNKPVTGNITIESDNGGNFDILAGLNGASILTGGVSGLKEDMVIAGQAGSYTIDQNGKNAFTLTIDADDTVGDVINKINASGMYKAYLDNDGKLVIATASAPSQSTPEVPSNNGLVTGSNTVEHTILTEEEAIAQGYTVIKTADEFYEKISANMSGKFILMASLDFEYVEREPIGSKSDPFTGILEGNGYSIDNLKISSSDSNVGLFASMQNATVSNLSFGTVTITNTNPSQQNGAYTGVLAGFITQSEIENVTVGNVVITAGGYVGGLVGMAKDSSINNSTVFGQITVSNSGYAAGGIVGIATDSKISNNHSNVYINNTTTYNYNIGGIVGTIYDSELKYNFFENRLYAPASDNSSIIGGIAGYAGSTTAENNYFRSGNIGTFVAFGGSSELETNGTTNGDMSSNSELSDAGFSSDIWDISSGSVRLKGIIQVFDIISAGTIEINNTSIQLSQGTIKNAIEEINAQSSQTGVVASLEDNKVVLKNTDGSTNNIAFAKGTSDFFDVAGIQMASSKTSSVQDTSGVINGTNDVTSSHLTEEDAIAQGYTIIKTAQDLQNMKNNLSGKYILMNDIDLSSISNWTSIGGDGDSFNGQLIGNGYTISNLKINGASTYAGLFGITAEQAVIKDVKLKDVTVVNTSTYDEAVTGGLVAINNGTIIDSSVSGTVKGSTVVGGLVGTNYGTITTSTFSGTAIIDSMSYLGGFVGTNFASITDCYMVGQVTRTANFETGTVGGFVGSNEGVIENAHVNVTMTNVHNSVTSGNIGVFAGRNAGYISDSILTANTGGKTIQDVGSLTATSTTNLTNVDSSAFIEPVYSSPVYEKLINAGTLYINNVEITLSNSNVTDAISQINAQSAKTGVVASIENNKVVLKNADGSANKISVESGTSDFFDIAGINTEIISDIEPSDDPISFVSNGSGSFTAVTGFTGSSALQGGVGGLTLDTVFANQAGSYTIDQNGKNAFTLNVEAGDTVGDIINKINASGLYTAHLNSDGKFVITAVGGTQTTNSNNGLVSGTNSVQSSHMSEAEAIAAGYTVIKTAQDLQNINNDMSGKYILMGDIDLSGISNWTPLGITELNNYQRPTAFTGELNGNGFVIKNMTVNLTSTNDNSGLFAKLQGAVIKNLGMENVNINSSSYNTGAIAGAAEDGTVISNSYVKGNIAGTSAVGGLVGTLITESRIETSYADVNVSLNSGYSGYTGSVGGLVGTSNNSTIENSYAKGTLTSLSNSTVTGVGGIVGSASRYSTISNCFAQTVIDSPSNYNTQKGGIVGYVGDVIAYLNNNYFDSTTAGLSAVYGYAMNGVSANENYALSDLSQMTKPDSWSDDIWDFSGSTPILKQNTSGATAVNSGTIKINNVSINLSGASIDDAISQINAQSSQTGVVASIENNKVVLKNADGSTNNIALEKGTSDFFDVAGISVTQGTSRAASQEPITVTVENAVETKVPSPITEEEAIAQGYTVIKTAQDLQNIANNLSGKYILMNDIDLSGIDWTPIGYSAVDDESNLAYYSFTGTLDGNGFVIKNLTVDTTGKHISADAGYGYGERINNAGLFGIIDGATIKNLGFVNASVKGDYFSGVIAGEVQFYNGRTSSSITNCYVENSSVGGGSEIYVGGLVGAVDGDINISNSYFAGDITYAKNSTGGLVGCHQSYNLEISNSYTSFTTNGTKSTNAQAIIGKKASTYLAPVVTNTYWNTDKTSLTSSYGTGLTSAQLKDQSNFTGWDADVWDFSSTTPTLKAPYTKTVYTLTGATMQGMTADTVVSGYKNSTAVFSSRDVNVQIETKPTDTVSDIMNQFKTQVEAQGYTFDWSISNGQITVTTNAGSFLFDGPDDNALVAMGLKNGTLAGSGSTDDSTDTDNTIPEVSTDPISFTSNGTGTLDQSLGFAASSVLTGATGGLSLDTKVSGSGSYVIAQEGQNSFTLNVENGDTIGDIINKINASGQYTAGLDENGKFFIRSGSATQSVSHISEEEAIAQGYTIIKTAQQLQDISNNLSGKYILMNDIDLTGFNWTAIGDYTNHNLGEDAFSGILDGNGYSINNFNQTTTDGEQCGLFNVIYNAEIKNLQISNASIKQDLGTAPGANPVGILASTAASSKISHVYVTNSEITGSWGYTGAIIGTLNNGSILENSYADVSISGSDSTVGGLVGLSYSETNEDANKILSSAFKGNITSSRTAGGIVGYADGLIIENSYSDAVLNADSVGGIIGQLTSSYGSHNVTINNTYSTSSITATSDSGSFIGEINSTNNLTINNSFTDTNISPVGSDVNGTNSPGGITVLDANKWQDPLTFTSAGWSTDIWDFSGDTPTLKNVGLVKENVSTKALEKPISVTAQEGATSNFESLVGFKTITLTGGVTGLTRETAGLTAGSFTIAQDGANAFTFEVKATDTVGDVIDRINAGGQYTASLDDQGRFVISAGDNAAKVYFGSKTGLSLDDTTLEHTDAYRETLRNGGHGTNNTYSDVIVGPTKFVIKTHKCVDGIEINLTDSSTTYQDIADAINAYSDELEVEAKFDSNGEFDIEGTETYYDDDRNGKFIKIEANYSECENFANGTGFIDSEGNCYTGMWHSIYSEYMSTSIYDGETGEYKGSGNNFRVDAGDTIQDIIDKINSQTTLQAGLDSLGRLYIASKDNPSDIVKIGAQIPYENSFIKYTGLDNLSAGTLPPGEITITQNSGSNSNFLEVTGFETEQSGSMEEVLGSDGYIQVTGSVTGLKASDVLGGLTTGTFTITQGANNINIAIESTDSLQDIIDKINATGKYTASIDSKGRFTIVSKEAGSVNLEFGGTSNFAGLAGLSEYTVEDNSITSIGTYDKYSTLTGNAYVNTDMTFSEGNFILSLGDKSVEFHVVEGESITSVMNKINNSDVGISASIQNNRLVLTSKTPGSEEIKLQDGTSNFAELTGFVGSGGSITNSVVKGQLSTYTSAYTAMSAQNQGISAGNFFVHLTDANGNITDTVEINVLKNESINSIMEKINNSGLGITASINDSGKMVITRNSSDTAGGVLVTRGSSDFTNKIGFTSGGHQSVDVNQGSSAQIVSQNSVTGSRKFSVGDFTLRLTGENAKDITISIDSSDTIDTIIHKINSMDIGITASLDANGKVVFERDADMGEGGIEIIKGSSDFTTVLGFTKGGAQSAVTVEGNTAEIISKTAVSASKRFSAGDFTISLTGENAKDITINISETNTITDIINKINEQNAGITAYLDSDRKLVIKRDADMGEGGIEIKKGSSNFTNEMGFTSGGNAIISAQTGSVATITGTSTVNTAESSGYSAGNFYIQMYNKDGSKGDLIQIDVGTSGINGAVDSVATIVNTINSKNAGITASIVNGKLVLTRDQDQAAGSFEIIKGSSDFTNKIGLTSGGNYIGDTTQGDAATQTVLTSDGLGDLLVRDSMTLGSIGVKNGTFRINGVDILVKASDTIYDLAARINSVFSDPKYADSRIIASYENGELTLRTKQASSTARIEVEAGSTNFTEIAKLTENYRNSVDLGKTELGQNAHFNINGKDYDMALDLNDITDDGIYNGNNLIYLDKDGNVVTDPNDAAITIELKKTGQTTIDIGNNLLNDSVSKLQNFVNKFNSAMNASENPILSDDSEFAAFINKIKSALTSNVGAYNKITQQLADIGIIVKVTGGTNSNMGSVHMSLSKTDGKYDYVEAFYQNPQKVFDIILGDYSQPLDNTVAGVFTRLSDVLHTNLESNRNGYFKVTPRLLESQQKAIKKEITSTTFDLNELKNIAMGTDSTEGLSEYLKQLEQQYQLINEAILALNKQYSNSLTKLILNQNNSSFNPIV